MMFILKNANLNYIAIDQPLGPAGPADLTSIRHWNYGHDQEISTCRTCGLHGFFLYSLVIVVRNSQQSTQTCTLFRLICSIKKELYTNIFHNQHEIPVRYACGVYNCNNNNLCDRRNSMGHNYHFFSI